MPCSWEKSCLKVRSNIKTKTRPDEEVVSEARSAKCEARRTKSKEESKSTKVEKIKFKPKWSAVNHKHTITMHCAHSCASFRCTNIQYAICQVCMYQTLARAAVYIQHPRCGISKQTRPNSFRTYPTRQTRIMRLRTNANTAFCVTVSVRS
jgi:hypothetical protein